MADNSRLITYLEGKSKEPFSWEENNCMSFVVDFLDIPVLNKSWFKGHSTPVKCYREFVKRSKEIGYDQLVDIFDDYLTPEFTLHPKDGFVVARQTEDLFGWSHGFSYQGLNLFFNESGLAAYTPKPLDLYWSIK